MRDIRHDNKAGKTGKSASAVILKPEAQDLTCNEAQVEDLLSKGESTENTSGEISPAKR